MEKDSVLVGREVSNGMKGIGLNEPQTQRDAPLCPLTVSSSQTHIHSLTRCFFQMFSSNITITFILILP